jgi:hypothetical protein
LEGERCWCTVSTILRARKGGGDNNGIYVFIGELGGSQAFQGLILEFFDFSTVHND